MKLFSSPSLFPHIINVAVGHCSLFIQYTQRLFTCLFASITSVLQGLHKFHFYEVAKRILLKNPDFWGIIPLHFLDYIVDLIHFLLQHLKTFHQWTILIHSENVEVQRLEIFFCLAFGLWDDPFRSRHWEPNRWIRQHNQIVVPGFPGKMLDGVFFLCL